MVFEKTMSTMVKGIRAHRGKETEYINTCLQEIRTEVVSKNPGTKSMAILKIAYLQMLGYDMSWCTFAIVEVMALNRFNTKRPGYLAAAIAFHQKTDVSLLTINLFKRALLSKSQYEAGMAVSCLSSICNLEISRDLLSDLLAMLNTSRPYLRKKIVLSLYRIYLQDPSALRTCFPKIKDRLGDEDQGVLTATVNTLVEIARKNADLLSLAPHLYHILVNTTNNWLLIKLLKLFQLLCPLEPRLPVKMVEPLTDLLNTCKAKSVEFEAIRCTVQTQPEGTSLMKLAIDRLQNLLNSADRNLRYLALQQFGVLLDKVKSKDKLAAALPDLHARVLESIEESDSTARKIALRLLDRIVSAQSYVDTVKKLLEFSGKANSPDEFIGSILRIGARDHYSLVVDFAWYLLTLAQMAQHADSMYADQIAEQMIDVTVRVSGVRPYAVNLALSLLTCTPDSTGSKVGASIAMPVVGSCAWILGEYHGTLSVPAEATMIAIGKALVASKWVQTLVASVQTQCIWAAEKVYLGAHKHAPAAVKELHELLTTYLGIFAQSTHVDVSERAVLCLQILEFEGSTTTGTLGTSLFQADMLPVHADAQGGMSVPAELDIDEPFFIVQQSDHDMFLPQGESNELLLGATYKEDIGFLTGSSPEPQISTSSNVKSSDSMFYLGKQQDASDAPVKIETALDPLDEMRQRLQASRIGEGMKYEVNRDDVLAPPVITSVVPSCVSTVQQSDEPSVLQSPSEKELLELQGRLWASSFRDANICVYTCIKSKNSKKQLLRMDVRCEKVGPSTISNVTLKLPNSDDMSNVVLVCGDLQEHSAKVKINLDLASFKSPFTGPFVCEIRYDNEGNSVTGTVEVGLPTTAFLTPALMSSDEISIFVSENQALVSQQFGHEVEFESVGMTEEALRQNLPVMMGRCTALCHFHGLVQAPGPNGYKFLLVARPPRAWLLPEGAMFVCFCKAQVKAATLKFRVTVKSCLQDVSAAIVSNLVDILRELVEGRLRII